MCVRESVCVSVCVCVCVCVCVPVCVPRTHARNAPPTADARSGVVPVGPARLSQRREEDGDRRQPAERRSPTAKVLTRAAAKLQRLVGDTAGGGDRRLHLLQRLRARQLRARRAARGQGAASGGREARRALCRETRSATMLHTRRALGSATMVQTHTCTAAAHCTHIRGAGTRSQHGGYLTG